MKALICAALALLMAGCCLKPRIEYREVRVPVVVPCVESAPVKPVYQFGVNEWKDGREAAAALIRDFEAADRYAVEWEAAAAGCLKVEPQAGPVAD